MGRAGFGGGDSLSVQSLALNETLSLFPHEKS